MIKKYLLGLLSFLIMVPLCAQQDEAIDFQYKALHYSAQEIFAPGKTFIYKTTNNEYRQKLESERLPKDSIWMIIDSIKSNSSLDIGDVSGKKNLRLKTTFPALSQSDDFQIRSNRNSTQFMKCRLISTEIQTTSGNPVEVTPTYGSSSNGNSKTITNNGIKKKYYYHNFYKNDKVSTPLESDQSYAGSATYLFSFVSGYDSVKLDIQAVNTTFELAGTDYKLIAVVDNKVVLEILQSGKVPVGEESGRYELRMMAVSANGSEAYRPYTFQEISDLRREAPEKLENVSTSLPIYSTVEKNSFELLRETPRMSVEEFRNVFPKERIEEIVKNNSIGKEKYLVLYSPILVTHFVLYHPVYHQEEITLKL
ncbi:hypothetical protein ACJD0Z_12340 [Flavobacteriaceae bacterium M23B6Z8]